MYPSETNNTFVGIITVFVVFLLCFVLILWNIPEPPEEKEYAHSLICNEDVIVEDVLNIWVSNGSYYISTEEPKNYSNKTYTPQNQLCETVKEEVPQSQ